MWPPTSIVVSLLFVLLGLFAGALAVSILLETLSLLGVLRTDDLSLAEGPLTIERPPPYTPDKPRVGPGA